MLSLGPLRYRGRSRATRAYHAYFSIAPSQKHGFCLPYRQPAQRVKRFFDTLGDADPGVPFAMNLPDQLRRERVCKLQAVAEAFVVAGVVAVAEHDPLAVFVKQKMIERTAVV